MVFMGLLLQGFTANAQYSQLDAGVKSVGFSIDSHRFRGWNFALLLADRKAKQGKFIAVGPTVKSWLLGTRQNLYVSAGLRLYHVDISKTQFSGGTVRNVLRYEPTRWQSLQLRADLEYSLSASGWLSSAQADIGVSNNLDLIMGWRRLHFHAEGGGLADGFRGFFFGLGSVW